MVLVRSFELRAVKPERLSSVGVVRREQWRVQAIDRRGFEARRKSRLCWLCLRVRCDWIGREIVIEGDVLLKDHDQVLNRRNGSGVLTGRRISRGSHCRCGYEGRGGKPNHRQTHVQACSHVLLLPENDPRWLT